MFDAPLDLTKTRILVSNDDGISAPGLALLEKIARTISDDVWVVAPEIEQSGAGHSLTLRLPLRIREVSPQRYAVDGTPTDCVLLAIRQIMQGRRPDLILSGINHGGNMGEDVTYSGTVAAAMEGTLMDVPALAFSLAVANGEEARWDAAEFWVPKVIERVAAIGWPKNTLINVNIPNLPPDQIKGIVAASQGRRKIGDNIVEALDPRGRKYYWIGPTRDEDVARVGTDIHEVTAGSVTVTPIYLDLTHQAALTELRRLLA